MKKFIVWLSLMGLAQIGFAAVNQPNQVGDIAPNKISMNQFTLAQINAITPDTTGQIVLCNNCTQSAVCISSGADTGHVGAFVVIAATGTFTGATFSGFPHCL